ncbi:MAG: hypothetical protein QM433_04315 [Euryarchaeota archaeon]|nr:hypothetical protein [Methanothrix harundinacea]MDI9398761.1 hypothetical protein [Euryarchaeota archaeon]
MPPNRPNACPRHRRIMPLRSCAFCNGRGESHGRRCPACGGKGEVMVATPAKRCTLCNGSGRLCIRGCPACGGTGWVGTIKGAQHPDSFLSEIQKSKSDL